jgi:hypothetical protein
MDEKNRIHSAVRNSIGKVIILCKRAHVSRLPIISATM